MEENSSLLCLIYLVLSIISLSLMITFYSPSPRCLDLGMQQDHYKTNDRLKNTSSHPFRQAVNKPAVYPDYLNDLIWRFNQKWSDPKCLLYLSEMINWLTDTLKYELPKWLSKRVIFANIPLFARLKNVEKCHHGFFFSLYKCFDN